MLPETASALSLDAVSHHYLSNLQHAAERLEVRASQDIYAANGMKLVSRGTRLDARIGEQLAMHRLRQPLGGQLQVVVGPLRDQVRQGMQQCLLQDAHLAAWLGQGQRGLLRDLAVLSLSPLAAQALKLIAARFPDVFSHSLRVAALAWSLAPSAREAQQLLLAGLLHDVGYLYLDPAIWQHGGPLSADAWRQFDAHPLIGFVWACELKAVPPEVARLILLHHERVDGSGYPTQPPASDMPPLAEALALAEMVAGILEHAAQPVGQLQVALQLLPGQFSAGVRQLALQRLARLTRETVLLQSQDILQSSLHQLLLRLARVYEVMQTLGSSRMGGAARQLYEHLLTRVNAIQRAFNSVGLDMLLKYTAAHDDGVQVWQELAWIINETNWLSRHLARYLARQRLHLPAAEAELFEPLMVLFLGLSSHMSEAGL